MSSRASKDQPFLWTEEELAGMSSAAESLLGVKGRRLPSNGGRRNPGIFKAVVFDSGGRRRWSGDIDIEQAGEALLSLSETLGPLYLIDGTDGRFLSRRPPPRFLRHIATVVIEGGRILYSDDLAERLGIIKKEDRGRSGGGR